MTTTASTDTISSTGSVELTILVCSYRAGTVPVTPITRSARASKFAAA